MAEIFTEDILIEILSRLPAKSLMRFKCVGKRWRSLISNPGFAKLHLQRLKAGDLIPSQRIFKTSPLESIDYELHDGVIGGDDDLAVVEVHELRLGNPRWQPPYLVGSCHGLVCLLVPGRFFLYNPTTRESRSFPCCDLVPQVPQNWLVYGFGYDPRSEDYKILQFGSANERQEAIFSLKSGSWRRIQVQRESQPTYFNQGVYWNGALHWCVVDMSRNECETAIMSFDLSEEKFHQVLPVPEVDGQVLFMGLGIHGANLFIYRGTYDDCCEAWTMNEYGRGGSWTKWFSVSTKRIPGYTEWQTVPVVYTRSGKIVFLIDMDKMILFNPRDNTCKDYPIRREIDVESATYLETLISPYLSCEPLTI
ncbi:hypothetical protein BT93_H1344 [Corymbia citriodora subsp. variegata]|nr:hypothetical protein BT93_H1344 [Corymbia citriodora subsp. variegata]